MFGHELIEWTSILANALMDTPMTIAKQVIRTNSEIYHVENQ